MVLVVVLVVVVVFADVPLLLPPLPPPPPMNDFVTARSILRRVSVSVLRPAKLYTNRAVMQPFLEARFTPGIVDGGERGSSKGLGPLLDELLAYVKEVRACFPCMCVRVCGRLRVTQARPR